MVPESITVKFILVESIVPSHRPSSRYQNTH